MRHWRQKWDPDVPLKYSRTFQLSDGIVVQRGDPVTDEHLALLGPRALHRLKIWFHANIVEHDERVSVPAAVKRVTSIGKGWFNVTAPDGTVTKIRGRQAARELAGELWLASA